MCWLELQLCELFYKPMPLTAKQLRTRNAKRDLGAVLLAFIREMKAGHGEVIGQFPTTTEKTIDANTRPFPRVVVFVAQTVQARQHTLMRS